MRVSCAAGAALLLVAGCSSDEPGGSDAFCDTARELVTASVDVSLDSGTSVEGAQQQLEAAQQSLARQRTLLERWPETAPAEVRDDVRVAAAERLRLLDVLEGRRALDSSSLAPADAAANQRVAVFTQQRCGVTLPLLDPPPPPNRQPPPPPDRQPPPPPPPPPPPTRR